MEIKPFKLERYFAKHEFSAPYILCASDCESFTIEELLSMSANSERNLKALKLSYTESLGSPTLRNEISKLYASASPENILVHSGAEEAIFSFMNCTLSKTDHIIVHYPCYQSLTEVAETIGCEVTYWRTRQENGWALDLDFLKDNIKPNTKALIINLPHNPTGCFASQDFYNAINEIAQQHNVLVFSDEVYRGLEYNRTNALPAFCDINEKAVSLGVMSKSYGLAGLRIGWIATKNKEVYDKMAGYKDYLTICNSAPSEFLAEIALTQKDHLINRNLGIIKFNIGLLDKFFEKHSSLLSWVKPVAGPIAFPSFKFGLSAESTTDRLLKEKGVLLLPGHLYDEDYKMNFRLGFGRKNMPEALELFGDFLTSL